ncbi:glycoside hydrolase [Microdochium bolleyi]|uniref:Glycoside hydrolase n=1 Tax=Microdochium bolleyi TaxID=196109 RepID=A0A136JDE5_9PEZI|nr:glycoside hydrolase [Microdochium bolleyi]
MLLPTLLLLLPLAAASNVFVHYMVQTLNAENAVTDVNKARAMGIDAFVLNIGWPTGAPWSDQCIERLFAAAAGTNFKFIFSLDVFQRSDPNQFRAIVDQYISHDNYFRAGPNNLPMLSTFGNAPGWGPEQWNTFRASLASETYFLPVFDSEGASEDYYTNPDQFWAQWAPALDGVFSWEQSWPGTSDTHQNISSGLDFAVLAAARTRGKAYMAGLSTLQYKHLGGQHWYRSGDVVMPERMTQLLALPAAQRPEFVQIQTWNDAGESHYIGPLHDEGLPAEITAYANQPEHPHDGWAPVFQSFAAAWKSGAASAAEMRAPSGSTGPVAGAMWHREFLATSACAGTDGKPRGAGAAVDSVNWAVVLNRDAAGEFYVQVTSGGEVIARDRLLPGLNYKAVGGVRLGEQVVEVVDGAGNKVIGGGKSTKGISADPTGSVCTYNVQVAQLV